MSYRTLVAVENNQVGGGGGGGTFPYSCTQTIKTISKEADNAGKEYMNIPPLSSH